MHHIIMFSLFVPSLGALVMWATVSPTLLLHHSSTCVCRSNTVKAVVVYTEYYRIMSDPYYAA